MHHFLLCHVKTNIYNQFNIFTVKQKIGRVQCELHKWTINCKKFFFWQKKMIHNNHANQNLLNLFKVNTDMPIFLISLKLCFAFTDNIDFTPGSWKRFLLRPGRSSKFELKGWHFSCIQSSQKLVASRWINRKELKK